MADNVTTQIDQIATIPTATQIATDEIGGVHHQKVKIEFGASDTATQVSTSNPLPVTVLSTDLSGLLTQSDFDTKTGSLTETAPATDTASSGLNGRLQRIAQRISSLIALLPAALGAGGGLKVDGSGTALPVSGTVALGAGSAVVGHVISDSGSTTAVTGNVASTVADGANVVEGSTTGAAVITDVNGTIQQYLRGLVKQWAAGALGVVLTAETTKVIGTVRVASGGIASGSLASGSIASGAVASGAVASGAFASGSISDGADVTQGAKTDAKSASTDATSITIMQVLKQISFSIQAAAASLAGTITVAAHAVTNAGTFAVQETTIVPVSTASLTSLASSATSAQLLASTAGRKGLLLVNTDSNAVLIKYGTTASATSFTVRLVQNAYWEMPKPIYTGRIDAIWEADGSGSLYATEL